jgi:hypothetical protein
VRTIPGFDYRTGQAVEKSTATWREEIRAAIAGGGHRLVVAGETLVFERVAENLGAPFGVQTSARLAVEIYSNVAADLRGDAGGAAGRGIRRRRPMQGRTSERESG